MSPLSLRIYAHVCQLAGAGALVYLAGFLANIVVPKSIDVGAGPLGPTLLVNAALIGLFAVQHSGMARQPFHRWWAERFPAAIERATYVLAATLCLGLLFWLWQPLPQLIYAFESTWAVVSMRSLFVLGWVLIGAAALSLDVTELFGTAQVNRSPAHVSVLRTPWLYRIVRHPLQLGMLLALWAAPSLSLGHTLFAAGFSVYVALGLRWEERDLVRTFGGAYEDYRRRVPALLPRLPGVPLGVSRVLVSVTLGVLFVVLAWRHGVS